MFTLMQSSAELQSVLLTNYSCSAAESVH